MALVGGVGRGDSENSASGIVHVSVMSITHLGPWTSLLFSRTSLSRLVHSESVD
jgi:hypothetical protein